MSQSEPVKKAGSAAERFMASAVGGCLEASPVRGRGVMVRRVTRRAGGADLDGGDAGDDVGRADGDEELVGAGGDLLEDVLVADVGVGWQAASDAGATQAGARSVREQRRSFIAGRPASSGRSGGRPRCRWHARRRRRRRRPRQSARPESGWKKLAQAVVAVGAGVVVEVDGAEEAVLAGLGHEEVGEGPLDREEHGGEDDAGDEGDLPGLPGAGALPEQVEREGGDDDAGSGTWPGRGA